MTRRQSDLRRIEDGLSAAREVVARVRSDGWSVRTKEGGDPVTEADLAVDRVLRATLPANGEGWLSEETADDPARLDCDRCWIVDPIDGTRHFVEGIPEWCISVALVEDGVPVAGGILNPDADVLVLGSVETGVTVNGQPVTPRPTEALEGARILASRSEWGRGDWQRYEEASFQVVPCGSVAWKLAQVAAGRACGTFTLRPRSEWDVAGGAALLRAAGLDYRRPDGIRPSFNAPRTELPGFLAGAPSLVEEFRRRWITHR